MDDSHALPPRLLALLEDMPLERLAFVPVPVRGRSDGWTVARQQGFIARLALGGCVSAAARGVGMTRRSAYRLRERPDAGSFAAAWDRARGWGVARTVDVSLEKALLGERVPIVRLGRCVGEVHRFDNRLALAVLNALDRRAERGPDPAAAFDALLRRIDPDGDAPPRKTKDFRGRHA
ncbi:MAG: hypothetical protein ACK40O_00085 [Allosphingosinicella sp.]